jgi:transaldolase
VRASSPLLEVVATTPTDVWNDSCAAGELEYALANGATGATSNPPLVLDVLRQEPEPWARQARDAYATTPGATESDVAWRIAEAIAIRGAGLLEPVFERTAGRKGRLSIQVSPVLYRDAAAMVEQAAHFDSLARSLGLLVTGGSDFHGLPRPAAELGSVRLKEGDVEALLAAGSRSTRP